MADPARAHPNRFRLLTFCAVAALGLAVAGCGSSGLSGVANLGGANKTGIAPISKATTTVAFEPFTGMPGNIADSLAQEIAVQAEANGIKLVQRVGAPATYRVKGFLSAVSSDNGANVVYVFDVFNASGKRLHRISGERQAGISSGDPWSGIATAQLTQIATDVIFQLDVWLGGGGQ
ncbi:ABC-type transport system substrate-binding protein [Amorphus suaedae]